MRQRRPRRPTDYRQKTAALAALNSAFLLSLWTAVFSAIAVVVLDGEKAELAALGLAGATALACVAVLIRKLRR
jgi:hypothetical protein